MGGSFWCALNSGLFWPRRSFRRFPGTVVVQVCDPIAPGLDKAEFMVRLQDEHGIHFPLHLGNAEAVPFPDASFDYAISEYGAAIWCDPYKWIPEAARLLRPGGELMFLGNSTLLMLNTAPDDEDAPVTTQLERPHSSTSRVRARSGAWRLVATH